MNQFLIFAFTSIALFCISLYALVTYAHLLRKILAINIMGSSVFLFLVAVAYRNRTETPDAVPHAMVLTGIVVAVSATAFALTLTRRIHAETGLTYLPDEDDLE